LLKKSDLVIFVSEGALRETEKYFTLSKSVVVHNGIDDKSFIPIDKCKARQMLGLPCNKKIILSVCTLKKEKKLDLVLKSMHLINDKNIIYYIVGEGAERKNLVKLINQFNLNDQVFFVGKKTYKEINLWMNAANILVQPSEFESFGLIFVEALMCKTPVIGTFVGGIPEIIKNNKNGLLIESNNVNALKNAIVDGLEKKWDYDFLRKSVIDFSISNMAKKVVDEMKKLVE
jgi:glycosyltransferase involved in cell wall biosynthesis